jgi:hypothetical protein
MGFDLPAIFPAYDRPVLQAGILIWVVNVKNPHFEGFI